MHGFLSFEAQVEMISLGKCNHGQRLAWSKLEREVSFYHGFVNCMVSKM